MTSPSAPSGMRTFTILWLGQFVSALGTGLGSFALGVWLYETTGSATQFGLLAAIAGITMMLLSPVAGVLADRMDRSDRPRHRLPRVPEPPPAPPGPRSSRHRPGPPGPRHLRG